MKIILCALSLGCFFTPSLEAQEDPRSRGTDRAHERGGPPPLLVPAGSGSDAKTGKASPPSPPPAFRPSPGVFGGPRPPAALRDPNLPRTASGRPNPPFLHDRAVAEVDGIPVRTDELNELVAYYQTFRPGSEDVLLRDAFQALVPLKVMEAAGADDIPAMRAKCGEAFEALCAEAPFEDVVAKYSDDSEAPTADGRYTFGREVAVQPFDRLAHIGPLEYLHGPFLTKYGYHILQVVGYQQGEQPKEDETEVRHVLVMYPVLKNLPEDDVRPWLAARVQACSIRILEPGIQGMIPPSLRGNLSVD